MVRAYCFLANLERTTSPVNVNTCVWQVKLAHFGSLFWPILSR
jgi:hypothetical protein